jgi:hypothetical protein
MVYNYSYGVKLRGLIWRLIADKRHDRLIRNLQDHFPRVYKPGERDSLAPTMSVIPA